jgi:O-succinylbenzoate synthase
MVEPLRAAHGTIDRRPVVLVRVGAGGSDGWGECSALAEATYSPETAAGAYELLRRRIGPDLLAGRPWRVPSATMASAAVEMAVLDRALRIEGRPLAAALGATAASVPAGAAVGRTATVDDLVARVGGLVAEGYGRVKVKIEPGWDLDPLRAVREAFPDLVLAADANGSYLAGDAGRLAALDDLGLAGLEQPAARDDLAGSGAIAERLVTPVLLDEGAGPLPDVVRAVEAGVADGVVVKAPSLGGLAEAVRLHDGGCVRGWPMWVGGMVESGVGRCALVALAALPGFTLPGDVSAADRWFERDLAPSPSVVDGRIAVPTGAGIGAVPDPAALDELAVDRVVLRAGADGAG